MAGCTMTRGLLSQGTAVLPERRCHFLPNLPAAFPQTLTAFPIRPTILTRLPIRRIRATSDSNDGQPVSQSSQRSVSQQESSPRDKLKPEAGASAKACLQCGRVKQLEDFEKSATSLDERSAACRACMATLRARRSGRPLFHLGLSVEDAWEQAKACTGCGAWKEIRDFARQGEGTFYRCRACQAKYVKPVRPEVDTPQECNKCGKVKPASEYHRKRHRQNGLAGICKGCCSEIEKARYAKYRASPMILKRPEKMCSLCGLTKPAEEFYGAKSIDGLQSSCKPCFKRTYLQRARDSKLAKVPAA